MFHFPSRAITNVIWLTFAFLDIFFEFDISGTSFYMTSVFCVW